MIVLLVLPCNGSQERGKEEITGVSLSFCPWDIPSATQDQQEVIAGCDVWTLSWESRCVLQLPLVLPCCLSGSSPCLTSFSSCSGQAWASLGTFLCLCPIPSLLREGVSLIPFSISAQTGSVGPEPRLGSQRREMRFVSAFCSDTSTQQMTRPNCICRAARIFQLFCKTKKASWTGDSR